MLKEAGGYYAITNTNQHANVLTIIDPDPNGDGNGVGAAAVGTILPRTEAMAQARLTAPEGRVKPLPHDNDGWIQPTVALLGDRKAFARGGGLDPLAHRPHRKILREISLTNDFASIQQLELTTLRKDYRVSP